jgi:hypothetical protein
MAMVMLRLLQGLCLVAFLPLFTAAQPSPTPEGSAVTFILDFPDSQPQHYSIHVNSSGPGRYESRGHPSPESDAPDNFAFEFAISAELRARIFALAARAGYFQKDVDSHRKNMAFTGQKTLRYQDARRSGESTYNYSANAAVQDLTNLFQNLSSTLEFGHRLDYDHRYQKLALDEELKRMQEMADTHMLAEVAAIQPILEEIIADQSVVNIARSRAQRLLVLAGNRP